jgi:hypothetical protein
MKKNDWGPPRRAVQTRRYGGLFRAITTAHGFVTDHGLLLGDVSACRAAIAALDPGNSISIVSRCARDDRHLEFSGLIANVCRTASVRLFGGSVMAATGSREAVRPTITEAIARGSPAVTALLLRMRSMQAVLTPAPAEAATAGACRLSGFKPGASSAHLPFAGMAGCGWATNSLPSVSGSIGKSGQTQKTGARQGGDFHRGSGRLG